jgi:hypothetical protein
MTDDIHMRGLEAPAPVIPDETVLSATKAITGAQAEITGLREHIDTDHGVMVQLGRIADAAVKMLEHVNMDTEEDRALHARAVSALRGRLDEIAMTMKEANDAARSRPEVPVPDGPEPCNEEK